MIERTPAVGVDAIPVPRQSYRFGHVHSRNADLERDERAAALWISDCERVDGFERRFEVHGTFGGARWRNLVRGKRCESAQRELGRLVTVTHRELVRWDRIGRSRPRKPVHGCRLVHRWEIQATRRCVECSPVSASGRRSRACSCGRATTRMTWGQDSASRRD